MSQKQFYGGCVVMVRFEGNFTDYEEAKRKRLGDVEPKRVRYKKLG